MSGLLLESQSCDSVTIRVFRSGYEMVEKRIKAIEGHAEVKFDPRQESQTIQKWWVGANTYGGAFGLFNVDNVFTKAKYSAGAAIYSDYHFHRNFSFGLEWMSMWGQPDTKDNIRIMHHINGRLNAEFSAFARLHFSIQLATGFAWWPEVDNVPFIHSTFSDNRTGWDFRASSGVNYLLTERDKLELTFGYWASSSTSDNIVWITHDSMVIGFGLQHRLKM